MRIVNIFGGLGNQMFQYALIKVLENQLNETVLADTHCFKGYTRHNGLEIEKIFSVELQLASKEGKLHVDLFLLEIGAVDAEEVTEIDRLPQVA